MLAVDRNYIRMPIDLDTGAFSLQPQDMMLDGLDVTLRNVTDAAATWQEAVLTVSTAAAEDVYTLAFHTCSYASASSYAPETAAVSVIFRLVEVNPGPDYLGAGLAPLPALYGVMSVAFALAAAAWARVLVVNRANLFKIHHLMLALAVVKAFSLLFQAIDYHFIKAEGHPEAGWAVTFYIIHVCVAGAGPQLGGGGSGGPRRLTRGSRRSPGSGKGCLTFITVLLVGAGFGFVKPILSHGEKIVIVVVLTLQVRAAGDGAVCGGRGRMLAHSPHPLPHPTYPPNLTHAPVPQVFANVAAIVLEEASEGSAARERWRTVGLLVDVVCCGAILFPVMWSIRFLEVCRCVGWSVHFRGPARPAGEARAPSLRNSVGGVGRKQAASMARRRCPSTS